ncbi:MAG: aminoglycoside phosphotransferase family protein [Bryobacteraceae bacterium]
MPGVAPALASPEARSPILASARPCARLVDRIPASHRRHGSLFPPRLVEQAAILARELADGSDTPVVVNRDAHLGNILAAEREPWLLIDPKPLVGDGTFDAGYLLLDRLGDAPTPARAAELVERIAEGLDAEPGRIQGWGLLRAVENALWALDVHSSPEADLAKATALAAGM